METLSTTQFFKMNSSLESWLDAFLSEQWTSDAGGELRNAGMPTDHSGQGRAGLAESDPDSWRECEGGAHRGTVHPGQTSQTACCCIWN